MGYEMGFIKNNGTYFDDAYWSWCGWENTDLHDEIVRLCGGETPSFGEDYEILVENLEFINVLYNKVSVKNDIYAVYREVSTIDSLLADEFLNSVDIYKKIDFAKSFILPREYSKYQPIATIIYERMKSGYNMLESLKEGYDRMIADGITEVIFYGG